jgi:RsiW-degrading membrane proteinase PrsW (M82 family)
MGSSTCCVCNQPVGSDAPRLGGRLYCDRHFAKVSRHRGSVTRSSLLTLLALVVFAGLVAVVAHLTKPTWDGTTLILVGVALSLVPAALWLAFFYLQDVLEPEPKGYVLGVFVLGALLAGAVGIPVVRDLFRVQDWVGTSLITNLLGSILIIGFVQEFLKYVAIRYSVYLLPEFDERMDGILYGTAAGLAIRIVVTALAQASFSGIMGYFLARAKFEEEPVWWLPLGLTIAATLNGLFTIARGGITRMGSVLSQRTANPWYGLVLAAAMAGATLAVLLFLVRRANQKTLSGGQGA